MSDVRCTYKRIYGVKYKNYWATPCGFKTQTVGKSWNFCPFCGKPILKAV